MACARGNVPINRTDVIARIIFPDLVKFNALAFKYALVLAGEYICNKTRGLYLDTADFFNYFCWQHNKFKTQIALHFTLLWHRYLIKYPLYNCLGCHIL